MWGCAGRHRVRLSVLSSMPPVKEATLQAEEPLPRNVEALSCGVLPANGFLI